MSGVICCSRGILDVLTRSALTFEEPTGTIDLAPLHESEEERASRGNVALTIQAACEIEETIGRTLEYVDGDTEIRESILFPGVTSLEGAVLVFRLIELGERP